MTKKNSKPESDNELESMANESLNQQDSAENESNSISDAAGNDTGQFENEKYLRLYSEFENFRRRTTKERLEWMQTASKDVILSILPVIDDMERAMKSLETMNDKSALEGMELIYKKLYQSLEKQGLKPMKALGEKFDADIHEAITQFAAPSPDMVGKVIDEVEKGYFLHDKVIRFAKVVVGN